MAVCVLPSNSQTPQGQGVWAKPAPHWSEWSPSGTCDQIGFGVDLAFDTPLPQMRDPFLIDLTCVGQMSSPKQSV